MRTMLQLGIVEEGRRDSNKTKSVKSKVSRGHAWHTSMSWQCIRPCTICCRKKHASGSASRLRCLT